LNSMFNVIFLVELLFNLYGSWFLNFWRSSWNVFDFIIVVSGILTMANAVSGPLSELKILRTFRIFRLFKRIKALNKIVTALLKAIPGVFNAFLIMLIVCRVLPSSLAMRVFAICRT
jgi:voltage-gated sodium channel